MSNMSHLTLDSMRYATMTQVRNERVRILNVATGEAHELLPGNVSTSAPAWSPDGRRLAVLTGNLSHYDITVMNADGSAPRRYPVPMHLNGWYGLSPDSLVWEMPWSPDGRFLAFRVSEADSKEQQKVGWSPNDQFQLALLDLNSGQTRVLATSSARIGRFVWRSDGHAIRTLKRTGTFGSSSLWSIVEIPLNGPERLLRDITSEFPKANGILFSSDREAVVTVATDKGIERYVVPLDGGAVRKLPNPAMEPGNRLGGTQIDGTWLRYGQVDSHGDVRTITFISTVDNSTRTLHFPFNGHHGANYPGGKQLLNVGKATGDTLWKIFLVPLDGSTPRLLCEIPGGTGGPLAASPDGRFVAYTSEGRYTSKIHEVDFGPALQAIGKR